MAKPGFQELFSRYLAGNTTEDETQQVLAQIAAGTNDQELNDWIATYWEQLEQTDGRYTSETGQPILNKILGSPDGQEKNTPVVSLRSRFLHQWRWIAASIILVLGIGSYFLVARKSKDPTTVAINAAGIQPGKAGAILTLADGSQLLLDTIQNGVIPLHGSSTAKVINGTLQYNNAGKEATYNTMSTPKGRQFGITLPDGTQVWLNSASSIRYPTAFTGHDRKVELTGEAYFEVAHNQDKPFLVSVNNKAVLQVLGTHFNVNAYEDEQDIATTLLEGSVAVNVLSASNHQNLNTHHTLYKNTVILKPGQQARVMNTVTDSTAVNSIKVTNANVNKVMAWKNGLFNFEDANLEQVMRQLSRWYNIEVVYEKGIPDIYFYGEMGRNMPLIDVLANLQTTGVRFRLEGRKLIVLPL